MRTPAGFECRYFYGDYYRGKQHEECRLVGGNTSNNWSPKLCQTCPMPRILQANACPNLNFEARVEKSWLGLKRQVKIQAYCTHAQQIVKIPEVGCGQCHTLPFDFKVKL